MEIKIKNKIKVGDQTEIIEEIHTCEVMEKGEDRKSTRLNSSH